MSRKKYIIGTLPRTMTVLLVIGLVIFITTNIIIYALYYRIVHDAQALTDSQCMEVNPLIIERKKSWEKLAYYIKEHSDGLDRKQVFHEEFKNYNEINKKFVDQQTIWIYASLQFQDRLDYQYLTPEPIKKILGADTLYRIYDVEMFKQTLENSDNYGQQEVDRTQDIKDKQHYVLSERAKVIEEAKNINNPWLYFMIYPRSVCPDENFDFPEVDLEEMFKPNKSIYSRNG